MTTTNPHFNAFQGSYSRDRAGAIFARMKARSAMCVNDWELLRTILQRGGTPVHRHRAPQDDDADSHIDPIEYVNTAHTQALAAEAGGARKTIIHLGNELGSTQPKRTAEWLEAGIRRCTELGRICYAANWSVKNPEPHMHIELAKKVYPAIIANGGKMCCHEGAYIDPETGRIYRTLQECIEGGTIGGYRESRHKYGFCVAVTEFAASKTPHDGYGEWIGDAEFAALVNDSARLVYAPDGVDRYIYTAEKWDLGRGFEYADKPALQDKFAATNVAYPVKECKNVTQIPDYSKHDWGQRINGAQVRTNGSNINVRPVPSEVGTSVVGTIGDGNNITYWNKPYPSEVGGKYRWYKILYNGVERFVAETAGLRFENPTLPAPELPPGAVILAPEQYQRWQSLANQMQALIEEVAPALPPGGFQDD